MAGGSATRTAEPPRVRVGPRPAVGEAARVVAAAVVFALAPVGCGLLNDDQPLPSTARVEITGDAPDALELVTSDDFLRVQNFDAGATYTQLLQADTAFVRPDFTRAYEIEGTHRFFVRLTNHSLMAAEIILSVSFDGKVEYLQRASLSEGGALEFSEVFFGT